MFQQLWLSPAGGPQFVLLKPASATLLQLPAAEEQKTKLPLSQWYHYRGQVSILRPSMGDEFALLLQKDANGALVTGKLAIFFAPPGLPQSGARG